jgi:hypothetical protein
MNKVLEIVELLRLVLFVVVSILWTNGMFVCHQKKREEVGSLELSFGRVTCVMGRVCERSSFPFLLCLSLPGTYDSTLFYSLVSLKFYNQKELQRTYFS